MKGPEAPPAKAPPSLMYSRSHDQGPREALGHGAVNTTRCWELMSQRQMGLRPVHSLTDGPGAHPTKAPPSLMYSRPQGQAINPEPSADRWGHLRLKGIPLAFSSALLGSETCQQVPLPNVQRISSANLTCNSGKDFGLDRPLTGAGRIHVQQASLTENQNRSWAPTLKP